MLAEDVEIAAGLSSPMAIVPPGPDRRTGAKLIPQAAAQQGVGRALTFAALGQIVEAAPVGGGRWKTAAGAAVVLEPGRQGLLGKGHLGDDDVFGRNVLVHAAVVAGLHHAPSC